MLVFMRYLLILIICLFSGVSVRAELLQAKVSMSQKLPALPSIFRVGTKFNADNLPPVNTTQDWIWTPSWLAGTYHRETQTYLSPTGPITVQSRTLDDKQTGQQLDAHGNIWNRYGLPTVQRVEGKGWVEWQIVNEIEPIQTTEHEVITRKRGLAIRVDSKSGKIKRAILKEQIVSLKPIGPGQVLLDGYIKVFDQDGKAKNEQHDQASMFLIQPFKPVGFDPETGLDLRQDLRNYLIARGLNNLVPAN